jgi:hypothetical protein
MPDRSPLDVLGASKRVLASMVITLGMLVVLSPRVSADVRPGEYSLEVNGTATADGTITLNISIEHDGVDPGNYQAVQWEVDYDESAVSFGTVAAGQTAPEQCAFTSDSGTAVLTGCIDLTGDALDFSGVAFMATFNCLARGLVSFNVTESQSFVAAASGNQPTHVHNAVVECSASSPDAVTPVPTSTPEPALETRVAELTAGTGGGETPPPGGETPQGSASPTSAARGTAAASLSGTAEANDVEDDNEDGGARNWLLITIVLATLAAAAGGGFIYYRRSRGA